MSSYQKKYISLKDASIISGYTVAELRNFCKIGLVPHRKIKRQLCVRFDAFEKINEHKSKAVPQSASQDKMKPSSASRSQVVPWKEELKGLVPFTTPAPAAVKILEPVAFAAALVMSLHLGLTPTVVDRMVSMLALTHATAEYASQSAEDLMVLSGEQAAGFVGLSAGSLNLASEAAESLASHSAKILASAVKVSGGTLAYMGALTEDLISTSVDVAFVIGGQVSGIKPLPDDASGYVVSQGAVAGAFSEEADTDGSVGAEESLLEQALIGIADGADKFERVVLEIDERAYNGLIETLQFESLDPIIQQTFRW
ncbi:MAG: hypothetical protein HY397_02895 [Candidatus Doudnabacteria bacterium]|nr:hypothetical protein [Candidatus Doudnabacteria bacterium]